MQVDSQLARRVSGERRRSLHGDMTKVRGLVVVVSLGWGVVASPYMVDEGDEIL